MFLIEIYSTLQARCFYVIFPFSVCNVFLCETCTPTVSISFWNSVTSHSLHMPKPSQLPSSITSIKLCWTFIICIIKGIKFSIFCTFLLDAFADHNFLFSIHSPYSSLFLSPPVLFLEFPSNTFKCHIFALVGRFQLELIYLYFPPSFHLTYNIPEHVLNEGHEMKTIEETMSVIHLENNYRKINTLEEIEIINPASSKYLLNDVIAGQNDPLYKLLPTSVI